MMRLSVWSAAITASIVGFGGTLALIIAAAQAVSATPDQTASWITAITLAIAIESAVLSWVYRMPIVAAYSTAGAALIGASTGLTIEQAVGGFIVSALLLIATGLLRPLTRLVARIPASVASGMLAGILIGFPLAAAKSAPSDPALVLPLVALFFVARRFNAPLAAIVVLVAGVALAWMLGRIDVAPSLGFARFEWVTPDFGLTTALGLGVPLYLVTMASQNLPGLALLRANDYHPPAGPLIWFTGLMSLVSAPFAASTSNLSAITASICVNPEAHPDKDQRWVTGIVYAGCYLAFAAFGASITGLVAALPPILIMLIAGLALLPPLMGAMSLALSDESERLAAIVTLAVTASGVTAFGIGAAFWGLACGISVLMISKYRHK